LNRLQLQVKKGANWEKVFLNDTAGSTLGRNDMAYISDISGTTLTIKLESLTGLVEIDSVTVYYEYCDEATTYTERDASSAVDGNGIDVTGIIGASDGNRLVLNKGDFVDLNFYYNAPVNPGYERSYFVKATGYYDFPNLTPIPPETAGPLMTQFLANRNNAYRFYLNRYRASSGGHCGIDVAYSSNNLISGNEI
jgi:hypothetical protein